MVEVSEAVSRSRGVASYTELRDSAPEDVKREWQRADKAAQDYSEYIQSLKEDPRYTDDYKAEQAWGRYLEVRDKVVSGREKAKELLTKQAASARKFSIPTVPEHGHYPITDSAIIASQNEASRIVRRIDRLGDSKGPFEPDVPNILSKEFGKGLEIAGAAGAATCRGAIAAAEELGVPVDSVVGPHRKERHHESLERAEYLDRLSQTVGGRVSEPPFKKPEDLPPQSFGDIFTKNKRTLARGPAKRRPSWK